MAKEKPKTQAQLAASKKKKKEGKAPKKNPKDEKTVTEEKAAVPARLISSIISIGLFILFLVMFLSPEGFLVEKLLLSFIVGVLG